MAWQLLDALLQSRVSYARAVEATRAELLDGETFEAAVKERREDLLVHSALGLLNRSRTSSRPSSAMTRDIRALFGSQRELGELATGYLYALADAEQVRAAMNVAAASRHGILDGRGRLVCDGSRVNDLPGALRCYLGCAIHLSGEPDGDYVVRLDPARRRATLFPLEDRKSVMPRSNLAVAIDLKRQDVTIRMAPRQLLRKADLLGLGARTKQRRSEVEYREAKGLQETTVFEKLDGIEGR